MSLKHEPEHPKSELWDNLEGYVGREVEGLFRMRGDMYTYDQFMLMYGKNLHNIVK